jgi:hypothetical protein
MPFVGSLAQLDLEANGSTVCARAVQRLERGDRWAWGCDLPLVVSVERDLCTPRYLAIHRLERAAAETSERVEVMATPDAWATPSDVEPLVVISRDKPRIRTKKTHAPGAKMSAAERMKFLRSGRKAPTASDGASDDAPRRVSGDPERAAAEILALLERRDLL